MFHGFLRKNDTFSMKHEKVSTTDSDRERLVSPLRVRNEGDEVLFNIKVIVFVENGFHKMSRKRKHVSTADSDRERLVSPLRVPHTGDEG